MRSWRCRDILEHRIILIFAIIAIYKIFLIKFLVNNIFILSFPLFFFLFFYNNSLVLEHNIEIIIL